MNNKFEINAPNQEDFNAKITAIGVGGGGGNIINNMINREVGHISFLAANTDHATLKNLVLAETKLYIGDKVSKGIGVGSDPKLGQQAAEEHVKDFEKVLAGNNLIFVTAALGKGTGSGGAPVVCKIAQETGALVIAVVAKCFTRDGERLTENADTAVAELEKCTNGIFVIENDIIKQTFPTIGHIEAYNKANDVLFDVMKIIVNIIQTPAYIKADMADIMYCLKNIGYFIPGVAESTGDDAGKSAVLEALKSPFYKNLELRPTGDTILQVTYGPKHTDAHIDQTIDTLRDAAGGNRKFNILTAENPTENSDKFKVEFIAPAQKKTTTSNNWDENDAIVKVEKESIAVKHDADANKYRYNQPKKHKYDYDNLFANKHNDEHNIHKMYMSKNDAIKIVSKLPNTIDAITGPISKLEDITGRPRGNNELKQLDIPAYLRYNGAIYNDNDKDSMDNLPEEEILFLQSLLKETFDPSVKQKIMQILEQKTNDSKNK